MKKPKYEIVQTDNKGRLRIRANRLKLLQANAFFVLLGDEVVAGPMPKHGHAFERVRTLRRQ